VRRRTIAILVIIVAAAGTAAAQRGFGFGRFFRVPANPPYDGAFQYCRAMYQPHPQGDGGNWLTDYPQADQNLPYRFSELTKAAVSRDARGNYNHAIVSLTSEELYRCPFIMMQEVGRLSLPEDDAAGLRDYLLKGGFLWVDDFWGEYAWHIFDVEIHKALPEYPIVDLPKSHAIFHTLYNVDGVAQIPAIGLWENTGQTSERGADSAVPHARAIFDEKGHMMVLITHNTDYSDAFEREGESRIYFERFAGLGYAFGINALLYSMMH
jgi:hypothetical protein